MHDCNGGGVFGESATYDHCLTLQFSGRALPCDARRERIMKWSARDVATILDHGPLQLLVRRHVRHKNGPLTKHRLATNSGQLE